MLKPDLTMQNLLNAEQAHETEETMVRSMLKITTEISHCRFENIII